MPRDPKGRFIGESQMLSAWLGTYLDYIWRDPLDVMLEAAIEWCRKKAARCVDFGSHDLRDVSGWALDGAIRRLHSHIDDANHWLSRANILEDARRRLEEMK